MPPWPAPSSSPSRASAPPSSPLVYATKIVASGAIDFFRRSPRLLLYLLLLHSSSHGEPPTHLQDISHDPLFGRSKPSNRESSGSPGRAHRRPRSPPVLAIVFLAAGAAPRSSSSTVPSSIARPSVPSSSLLSSSPPLDLSSSLTPSPTGLKPASHPPSPSSIVAVSGVTPFFPLHRRYLIQLLPHGPQPRLTHLNLYRNALSGSKLHRPPLPQHYPPLLHTSDLSLAGHHYPDVIPRRPPLASCCVAIISHPGCAIAEPPPPLPLSSRETKENLLGSTRGR